MSRTCFADPLPLPETLLRCALRSCLSPERLNHEPPYIHQGRCIAAATPTVTAFADTPDHVTLAHLLDLHTRAYEADSVEWGKLNDIQQEADAADTLPVSREAELLQALGYHEQKQRCEDSRTIVRRMEAAIFAYQLQSIDDVLLLTRWVHTRLGDCRCYFYEEPVIIESIFGQIAQARNTSKVDA